jgi:hypothetical protein
MRRPQSEKPVLMNIRSRVLCRTLLPCLLVLGVAGAIATGCSEKAPVAPTPPPVPPTVTSVSVAGPGSAQAGQTAAMVAVANMSDGTTQTVTTTAMWLSSNPAAAPVSATGVVTFQAVGESDIRATFSGQTGMLHVTVTARPASSFTLFGIVTETNSNRPVLGARVEVINGPNVGRNTTTDGNGYYSMPLVEGTFALRFSRNDYELREVTGTLSVDTRLDITMKSTLPPPPDVSKFFGTYRVNLSTGSENCPGDPVTPGSSGTLELSGRDDGSRATASITERGQTRTYNGSMSEDGGFGGTGSGLIGLRGFQTHEYNGSLGARVSGNSISGTETLRITVPCPGSVLTIRFSGSR